jgi:amyloid beta precursor protein binding protein 1
VVVEEADLGVNFFLDEECLGLPRADCCVKLLQELNPDVAGESFYFGQVATRSLHAWLRC